MSINNKNNLLTVVDNIYNERFKNIINQVEPVYEILDLPQCKQNTNETNAEQSSHDVWIFGYGSLMWKANFPFTERKTGFINGYLRRFYQHSIDHRGTKQRPGRVVTLVTASPTDRVYGVAYRIADDDKEYVLQHLDYREKNGYQRCVTAFYEYPEIIPNVTFDIVTYIATPDNESWAGDADNSSIANIVKQIVTSRGESGTNRQYLFNLAHSMEVLFPGIHDDHLLELMKGVLTFIKTQEAAVLEGVVRKEITAILKKCNFSCDGDIPDTAKSLLHVLHLGCLVEGWRESLYTHVPLNDINL